MFLSLSLSLCEKNNLICVKNIQIQVKYMYMSKNF